METNLKVGSTYVGSDNMRINSLKEFTVIDEAADIIKVQWLYGSVEWLYKSIFVEDRHYRILAEVVPTKPF